MVIEVGVGKERGDGEVGVSKRRRRGKGGTTGRGWDEEGKARTEEEKDKGGQQNGEQMKGIERKSRIISLLILQSTKTI